MNTKNRPMTALDEATTRLLESRSACSAEVRRREEAIARARRRGRTWEETKVEMLGRLP